MATSADDAKETPSNSAITIHDFELGETLHTGPFTTVLTARLRPSGKPSLPSDLRATYVALKVVDKRQSLRAQTLSRVIQERRVHARLNHINVLRMLGAFHDEQCVFFLLELCRGGTLAAALQARHDGRLAAHDTRQVVIQLINALEYIHAQGIVHCDLKPENILFLRANADGSARLDSLRLADFGSAVVLEVHTGEPGSESEGSGRTASLNYTVHSTVWCTAPEVLKHQRVTKASDMWGLGCLIFYCLSGTLLFGSERSAVDAQRAIVFQEPDALRQRVLEAVQALPDAHDLICGLVDRVPEQRYTAAQVRAHPFLAG
ncbi:3-phosphoinositide-dependent protein kinase 2 [Porphyridium purpureum]|uniref:3-phosphoinositide-dependent protein kinase 2 n=1 Tax=Porphyridium purpureum TaxID=35688 RepID=A0A5J4Z3U8_PORPP|nr:3-phosphoinositide-dependent protein kinase 2 [Porphyridium purpureum]|eukprot:POR4777..scf295_1